MSMYRRRTFKRRPTGFRRRTGLRTVTQNGAQRWERGEIGHINGLAVDEDVETFTLSISVAQLAGHILPRNDTDQIRAAVSVENMTRAMEIGGISMDLGFNVPAIQPGGNDNFGTDHGLFCMVGAVLFVDRLDSSGVPNALSPQYGRAGTPMADPSTLVGPGLFENNDFPQRILWRRSSHVDFSVQDLGTNVYRAERQVFQPHWHVNRRLRIRLPDDQGLFLAYWTRRASNWPDETTMSLRCYMAGSLYYRIRF